MKRLFLSLVATLLIGLLGIGIAISLKGFLRNEPPREVLEHAKRQPDSWSGFMLKNDYFNLDVENRHKFWLQFRNREIPRLVEAGKVSEAQRYFEERYPSPLSEERKRLEEKYRPTFDKCMEQAAREAGSDQGLRILLGVCSKDYSANTTPKWVPKS